MVVGKTESSVVRFTYNHTVVIFWAMQNISETLGKKFLSHVYFHFLWNTSHFQVLTSHETHLFSEFCLTWDTSRCVFSLHMKYISRRSFTSYETPICIFSLHMKLFPLRIFTSHETHLIMVFSLHMRHY